VALPVTPRSPLPLWPAGRCGPLAAAGRWLPLWPAGCRWPL